MKKCLILIVSFFLVLQLKANDFSLEMKKSDVFNHLDVALSLGTTGIGFDLATPIYKDLLQLRAGYAFMPGFRQTLTFGVDNYTKDGTIVSSKKQQISELMKKFTGYDVERHYFINDLGKKIALLVIGIEKYEEISHQTDDRMFFLYSIEVSGKTATVRVKHNVVCRGHENINAFIRILLDKYIEWLNR